MESTKRIASGAMLTALCLVLMLLGAFLELSMYAAPLLAGVCLIPYGSKYGRKYQAMVCVAVSLLSFMLVVNIEQNLMFAGLFGWYPMLRHGLQRLIKPLRIVIKLALFNVVVISIEAFVMLVLVPEAMSRLMMLILLVLSNATFLVYDFAIPFMELRLEALKKLM